VRAAALSLLAAVGPQTAVATPSTVAELGAALADGDERVPQAALGALAAGVRLPPSDAAPNLSRLRTLARHDDRWWMRRQALAALASQLGAEAAPILAEALRDDAYAYVREQAATCLGDQGGAAARQALSAAAEGDPEPRVRLAAQRALRRLPPQVAAPAAGQRP
jgi:HEAT repeat protein